ncbi:MAG: HAD family hydrolase [Oscillospiraceae bacterium]|nr:HAD family hydrolase [Oscillospiraceae bacterium]
MNIKAVVFDIGGTLMEYKNMPNVWIDYYKTGFEFVRDKLGLNISDSDIEKSVEVLKSYNPRVRYREEDISPEVIFGNACAHWDCPFDLDNVVDVFYRSMGLMSYIYPETISVLEKLKAQGYIIATLTDVATGMPDKLHKSYFPELIMYFDMYVSSLSCGYRKPNPKGLEDISERFGISPDEIIFVGDEEKDIVVAKRFGCQSVLIDRKGRGEQFRQDYTITDLNGLWKVLK